jgi:site-specific recombinase XerD
VHYSQTTLETCGRLILEHLTQDELTRLLTLARKHSTRDWLMLLVSFTHGLRVSEVVGKDGLTAADVQDGFLTVERLKGSMKTTQPLRHASDPLFDEKTALEAWCREYPSGPLFPISRKRAWQIVQELGRAASIPKHLCHPHILKHSCAMLSIGKAGIENVRQYLGHKSISSTGAYLKVDDDEASKAFASAIGELGV